MAVRMRYPDGLVLYKCAAAYRRIRNSYRGEYYDYSRKAKS